MRSFVADFQQRRRQVRRYFGTLASAERLAKQSSLSSQIERINVLRAGAFLILYNLIESAARASVQEILDTLRSGQIPFQDLRPTIRYEVVKGFKRNASADKQQHMVDVPVELVTCSLDVESHFNGNVDSRRIREIASVFGFSTDSDRLKTRDGAYLLEIKTNRNDLAHGLKSYDDIGRNYPIKDLLRIALYSVAYVESILLNIDGYLDREEFLSRNAQDAA